MMVNAVNEQLHVIATNYVGLASYVVLVYDYLLTLSDEVTLIWNRKKGPVIYLFFLNRYFFLFAFIPNLIAYLLPEFDARMCTHFVRYEGAQALISFGVAGLMMAFRVNAIYGGNCRPVQALLSILWLLQIVVYSVFLSTGIPVPRHAHFNDGGCSMIFNPNRSGVAALSAATPVIFDSAVLALTLYKCAGTVRRRGGAKCPSLLLSKPLLEEGLIYYAVVFASNLALTIMIVIAAPGLKNILSQFTQLITATMISRITLHLRAVGERRQNSLIISPSSFPPFHSHTNTDAKTHTSSSESVSTTRTAVYTAPSVLEPHPVAGPSSSGPALTTAAVGAKRKPRPLSLDDVNIPSASLDCDNDNFAMEIPRAIESVGPDAPVTIASRCVSKSQPESSWDDAATLEAGTLIDNPASHELDPEVSSDWDDAPTLSPDSEPSSLRGSKTPSEGSSAAEEAISRITLPLPAQRNSLYLRPLVLLQAASGALVPERSRNVEVSVAVEVQTDVAFR